MKTLKIFIAASILFMMTANQHSDAQVSIGLGITVRPAPVVVVRPAAPQAGYIWVDGDYVWDGVAAQYAWHPGYWMAPRPGFRWIVGRWHRSHGRWFWVSGYWRR